MMTKKEFDNYVEAQMKLKQEAETLLEWYHDNIKDISGFKFLEFSSIDNDSDYLEFSGEETWSYGGHEEYWYSIPSELLYSEKAREDLYAKTIEENEKKEQELIALEAKKKKTKEEKEEKEEKEKAQYLKLKRKYEYEHGV